MRHLSRASIALDVGHHCDVPASCSRPHGHPCTIEAALAFETTPHALADLADQLLAIRSELANRSLNDMIAPSAPTAEGLALWTWERLALRFGDALHSVRADLGGLSHEVLS